MTQAINYTSYQLQNAQATNGQTTLQAEVGQLQTTIQSLEERIGRWEALYLPAMFERMRELQPYPAFTPSSASSPRPEREGEENHPHNQQPIISSK